METLTLPVAYVAGHPGFTVDAGGSITKVLYRPKESGKKTESKDEETLHMTVLPTSDIDGLCKLISEKCDLRVDKDQGTKVKVTGVRMAYIFSRLKKQFGIRADLKPEFSCISRAVHFLLKTESPRDLFFPLTQEQHQAYYQSVGDFAHTFDSLFGHDIEVKGLSDMSTADLVEAVDDYNNRAVEWPVMVGNGGSGFSIIQDFCCIADMASRGDHTKVDLMAGDLQGDPSGEVENVYASFPDYLTLFHFGKLHDDEIEGTPSKEDMAASMLYMLCSDICQVFALNCQRAGVNTALLCGAFFSHPFIRDCMMDAWNQRRLCDVKLCKMDLRILKRSAYFTIIGTWLKHFDDDQPGTNT